MTGYQIVDGDPARGLAAAQPRGWLWALAVMVVAQWVLQFSYEPAKLAMMMGGGVLSLVATDFALPHLLWLIVPFGVVGLLTVLYAKQSQQRGWRALGVNSRALLGWPVWVVAGLLSGAPILYWLATLPSGWERTALEAAAVLTPATIVQAGAEEILFRGLILTSLVARYGAPRGIFVSAIVFALWHIYAGQPAPDMLVRAASTFLFGLLAGVVVLHQGHLGGAIALHVVWNVIADMESGISGYGGIVPLSHADFWMAYGINAYAPWTFEDIADSTVFNELLLPLFIEVACVFVLCRSTLRRLFGFRDD